jgi:hemerythrin-like domain-containing protein
LASDLQLLGQGANFMMTIYEALKKDHREVLEMFDTLIAGEDADTHLIEEIRDALIPHSRAEEAVFYNSIRAVDADSGKVMHSYAEHIAAEALLRTLQVEGKLNTGWKTTAKKLKDALSHHIAEEESYVFALAQKIFTDEEAVKIGEAFQKMKPKVKEEGFMKTSLDLVANLLPTRFHKTVVGKDSHR